MIYTPDKWIMLKFNYNDDIVYKILGTWLGGYARGDSWRLNSGVTRVEEDQEFYYFYGFGESLYKCHKETYGMGLYTEQVLLNWQKQAEGSADITLEVLQEETNFMEINYEQMDA